MTKFTINNEEIICNNNMPDNEVIYVNSAFLIKDTVIVQTTNKYIMDLMKDMKNMNKNELISISNRIYKFILSADTDKIYNIEKKWQDFCDNIILVYVTRYMLYDNPIPITSYENFKNYKLEKKLKEN